MSQDAGEDKEEK